MDWVFLGACILIGIVGWGAVALADRRRRGRMR